MSYSSDTNSELAKKYPVIVFIHGESYEWNSGNVYDGTVLASYGSLIVVTVNYRLGILGFLNTNTDVNQKSPSNYGLMDQIAALHWLQENVAYFGGDPTNVTLLGHGTGAACVNFLMSSTAVPDGTLFHRVILMSGSSLSPWALVRDPINYAKQLADAANCTFDTSHQQLLKCFRECTLETLLSVPIDVPEFITPFGPNIDGVIIDPGITLPTKTAENTDKINDYWNSPGRPKGFVLPPGDYITMVLTNSAFRQKLISKLSRYDMMVGVVPAEAFFMFTSDDIQYGIEDEKRSKILRSFLKNNYKYHLSEISATIVNEYTEWERPIQHPVNIRDETMEALTDAQYAAPAIQIADLHSSARRNSYLYVFEYQTKNGDYPQRQGCVHGEDLPYIFGAPLVNSGLTHFAQNYTKSETALSEAVITYVSNFASTGNPNDPGPTQDLPPSATHNRNDQTEKNRLKNIEWTAYEAVHKKYISFDAKIKLKNHYRAHKLSFWLNLVPDLHQSGADDIPPSHHQLPPDEVYYPQSNIPSKSSARPNSPPVKSANNNGGSINSGSNEVFNGSLDMPVVVVASSSSDRNTLTKAAATSGAAAAAGSHIRSSSSSKTNNGDVGGKEDELLMNSGGSVSNNDVVGQTTDQQQDGFAKYSTALIITIVIGCVLLTFNVLVFVVVYYRRDRSGQSNAVATGDADSAQDEKNARRGSVISLNSNNSYEAAASHSMDASVMHTFKRVTENGGPGVINVRRSAGAKELLHKNFGGGGGSGSIMDQSTALMLEPINQMNQRNSQRYRSMHCYPERYIRTGNECEIGGHRQQHHHPLQQYAKLSRSSEFTPPPPVGWASDEQQQQQQHERSRNVHWQPQQQPNVVINRYDGNNFAVGSSSVTTMPLRTTARVQMKNQSVNTNGNCDGSVEEVDIDRTAAADNVQII